MASAIPRTTFVFAFALDEPEKVSPKHCGSPRENAAA